jgi:hypothetical protein
MAYEVPALWILVAGSSREDWPGVEVGTGRDEVFCPRPLAGEAQLGVMA